MLTQHTSTCGKSTGTSTGARPGRPSCSLTQRHLQRGWFSRTPLHCPHRILSSSQAGCRLCSGKKRQYSASVRASSAAGAADLPAPRENLGDRIGAFRNAFWKFLRPHTIRGTILGSCAVTARVLLECSEYIDWGLAPRAALGVLALLCGNGYIVGINQIYDVDIDTINKPFLPVAAGELRPALAWVLVVGLAAGGLALTAANFGRTITLLYSLGLFLGTVYSVPPFRLKRFAVAAFLIIATVRGFLLNFGVFTAVRAALGAPFVWSPAIIFITCFVTVFATVIAITKDLPDMEGDLKYKIDTFATRLGTKNLARLGTALLVANYVGAVVTALRMPHAFRVPLMVGAHAVLALNIILETRRLESQQHSQLAIRQYYQAIWRLFYIEYCLLPFL
ncbi:hypothetical protein WJX73_001094 [Symbiochloris irregularis]|uniref:Homogentisate prenyltransferase n=1 Tax=Symbiochloris irregularis TaxID=706552 RepID=A0AAW1NSE8_9CHLO